MRKSSLAVALLAIGLTWAGLRVVFWNGYYTEDSPGYVTDAIYMALGDYHARDNVNGMNVGTYLPVAPSIWLFGKSEIALSVWPAACSLLGVISLGGLAAVLFGRAFGLLAALLYATYPGDVFFSTVVMPDSIQSGWLSFSMFLIVLSYLGSTHRRLWTLAWAGVAMGVCHLIRANGAILFPVGICAVVAYSLVWKHETSTQAFRGCLAYLAGSAVVVATEGAVYLWAARDFFLRFHVVNRHYGTLGSVQQWGLNTDPRTIPFSIFSPVEWWMSGTWGLLNRDQSYHALTFVWAALSLLAALVAMKFARSRLPERLIAGSFVAMFWFAWPLLYHQFGSQSLTHFVPIHRLSRQLVLYAPGAIFAIVTGCCLMTEALRTWHSGNGRRIFIALSGSMLLVHLYFNWMGVRIAYDAYQPLKATSVRIRAHLPPGGMTIVGDPSDLAILDFWLNPLGQETVKVMVFANYASCDELTRGIVLTYSNPGWDRPVAPVIQDTVKRLPCLLNPPATWRLLYGGFQEKVYVIP